MERKNINTPKQGQGKAETREKNSNNNSKSRRYVRSKTREHLAPVPRHAGRNSLVDGGDGARVWFCVLARSACLENGDNGRGLSVTCDPDNALPGEMTSPRQEKAERFANFNKPHSVASQNARKRHRPGLRAAACAQSLAASACQHSRSTPATSCSQSRRPVRRENGEAMAIRRQAGRL